MQLTKIAIAVTFAAGVVSFSPEASAQHDRAHSAAAIDAQSPEARRADIAVFRTQFLAADRSYSAAARTEAERRLNALEAQTTTVSQAYFELELARIVALADNGHTSFFPGPRSRRYNRAEVRLVPFGEEFYVLRAREVDADLLGAQLIGIDDQAMPALREAARSLIGGTPGWRDRNAGYFFESPQLLHASGLIADPDRAIYRFRLRDGREVQRAVTIEAANENRLRANADRWLSPAPMSGESAEWRTLLPAEAAPWSLQEPDVPFRYRRAPEIDGIVIELRQNNDAEDKPIASALRQFERAIADESPSNLVLDMRLNAGGDLNTTRAFVRSLPERIPGRIFVLTSPWTFSAAISSVGYLEQVAPERVVIVGEQVGDRLNFFAEGAIVQLPHSGAAILNATERHDYQTGCRGFSDCHGSVVRNPIAVPSLAPDISAPWTIEAYAAGRDPAMDAVVAALR